MTSAPRKLASASAARLSGDDYQHAYTLMHAVRLLREDVWGVTRVCMEVGGAGNVDDLVVERAQKSPLYHQVKFSRTVGEVLDHEWFTDPAAAKRSPLQRFYDSFVKLTVDTERPRMALVTNRTPAPDDPILKHLEGRDGLLTPRLFVANAGSDSGRLRRTWAEHLDISEVELFEMLDNLELHLGMGTFEVLRERCAETMLAAGLRGDSEAVMLGYAAIRDLIEQGCDELDADAMRELVAQLRLAADHGTASLLVQAIDRSPYAESATVAVDWVDRYEGDEPRARRRLKDPDSAIAAMGHDLVGAGKRIKAAGYERVQVGGAFRLDTAFAVGAQFADTAGYELLAKQGGEVWETAGEPAELEMSTREHDLGLGVELAICLSVSNDITDEVLRFIGETLPVQRLLTIVPAAGASRHSITDASLARGGAQAILNIVRDASPDVGQIHLFMSTPNALALMLGHVWNRLPPTQVYADANPGYTPTFQVAG